MSRPKKILPVEEAFRLALLARTRTNTPEAIDRADAKLAEAMRAAHLGRIRYIRMTPKENT